MILRGLLLNLKELVAFLGGGGWGGEGGGTQFAVPSSQFAVKGNTLRMNLLCRIVRD